MLTTMVKNVLRIVGGLMLVFGSVSANAVAINWVDWTSATTDSNGFTAFGTIMSGTETVNVTYNNPQGIAFFQDGVGAEIDYWQNNRNGRNPATSPYTSTGSNGVDNIPTGTDMIALRFAGSQTLSFSQAIANPVFSYISLNRNGYGFDQDFDILSVGGVDGNDCGYWGCGTSSKNVTANEFQLIGTGEPHGTLRFTGAFDSVTWRSLSAENWNGFTVGIQGTATQVFPCQQNPSLPQCNAGSVPEPGTLVLIGLGLVSLSLMRKRKA